VNTVGFVFGVVFGLMLAELRVSRAHERRLREAGAIEPPGDVYRAMAVLYPASFLVMTIEGFWRAASASALPGSTGPAWAVSGLVLFVASKALKYWAIRALGERWSFRVLVQPGRPLVRDGPYRYVAHPNYIGVLGELVGTAMMVGAAISGPVMLGLFGAVLWARWRFETRVLASGAVEAAPAGKD
jgi:methyltransferase